MKHLKNFPVNVIKRIASLIITNSNFAQLQLSQHLNLQRIKRKNEIRSHRFKKNSPISCLRKGKSYLKGILMNFANYNLFMSDMSYVQLTTSDKVRHCLFLKITVEKTSKLLTYLIRFLVILDKAFYNVHKISYYLYQTL